MPKRKQDFNTIYISERLQEALRPISRCALTAVVAPMGYGKTTAVNWYLAERRKEENARIIRISVYSDNLAIFWKSVQDAFLRAGLSILLDYPCPTDAAGGSLLSDDLCHALAGEKPCYLFIDDFHLLTDVHTAAFLCTLANRLPENVHVIVASRDRFLPFAAQVRLGGRLCQLGTAELRLNHAELAVYAHRCGTALSDAEISSLLYMSEGWFSAIYLHLRTLAERGTLPNRKSDIYTMFTAAMIAPLPADAREFLAVMGLADEFTLEMAHFITETPHTEKLLTTLTEQNAFVKRLPDGKVYRFHHMMKECAKRTFHTLPPEKQAAYRSRFGIWYEEHRQYLHAMAAYRQGRNYDALLRIVEQDAGILLSSLSPKAVLKAIEECPVSILKEHPLAILVLMRSMFNWRLIPEMMRMKELLLTAIAEHPELPEQEKGNLLGECDLILSFLMYNDISAMSRLHRSASKQMSRPAVSIQNVGGWSFGSPSVLMMYHREPGALKKELAEMEECMPHYYKITNGHGQGAEKIMSAEAYFLQGKFTDAQIALEQAYAQIEGNGQENIALCCDFLARRLSLCIETEERASFAARRAYLLKQHNTAWLNIFNATAAYYYALLGETEEIPEIFRTHTLFSVNILVPGKPMIEMVENQVYLAQGAYAKVIGRSEGLLAACAGLQYALVALHLRIQTAAAYAMLGKTEEAQALLLQALQEAEPDEFLLPFVENYRYIKKTLEKLPQTPLIARIQRLGKASEQRQKQLSTHRPASLVALTEREYEIVKLMASRLRNREIAEKLFLSEGSVKQYINQIYSKLQIEGDAHSKRKQLFQLLEEKT